MIRSVRRAVAARTVVVALVGGVLLAACGGGGSSSSVYAGIEVSASSLDTAENGASVPLAVRLTTAPTGAVSVLLAVDDPTEGELLKAGATTSSPSVTLTFSTTNWSTAQTVQVVPQDDTDRDGPITYTITAGALSMSDATYAAVPPRTIAVTNADDEVPGFTITQTSLSTTEAGASVSFYVRLNVAPESTVTIPITSTDVTEAQVGTTTSMRVETLDLTFTTSNWSLGQQVWVHPVDDRVDDGNQTFDVVVGPPRGPAVYASLLAKTVSVTNADDDTAGITITGGATTLVTSENGTTATFSVNLNAEPAVDTVVEVRSTNTAEGLLSGAGQNGVPIVNLTFTSANWASPQEITVTGQDEPVTQVPGDDVTYSVVVGPATGDPAYAALATKSVSVRNTDNDTPVVIVPNTVLQTRESGVRTAAFTVAINRAPAADVVVPITTNAPTEGLIEDPAAPATPVTTLNVTFTPADWRTPRTVTVVGQPDAIADGNRQYTLTVGTPTGDPAYASVAPQTIQAVNADTDVAGYTVSKTELSVREGDAPDTFTVVLNVKPAANVVIPVTSAKPDEGLLAGGDSVGTFVQTVHLTFTPDDWQTPQTVQLQGQVDHLDDQNQVYYVTVGPTASGSSPYNALASRNLTAWTLDVDHADLTVLPAPGFTTTDAGGTTTFTVQLTTIPSGTVTVSVTLSDPTEVLVSAGGTPAESVTLDFTAADWDQPKTVTVTGQPDGVLDDDQLFTLWVTTLDGTDTNYNSVGLFYLYGTNVDTDVGVSEGTAAAPYALTNGVAWSGQVGPSSSSYYVVELAPGVPFGFNLRVISDTLSVTVDDDGVFTSGNLCSWGPLPRDNVATCAGTVPAAGRVYVRVTTTSAAGAGYLMYAGTAKTFTSTEVPMAIPDGSATGAASGVVVAGGPLVLSKVVVRLTIAHPNDGDLTIGLKRPDGYTLQLANWIGGTGDGFVDTVFDDAAATSIAFGTAPFTGSFAPIVALDYLAGNSSEGTWQLVVTDQTSGNAGSIVSWSMTIY